MRKLKVLIVDDDELHQTELRDIVREVFGRELVDFRLVEGFTERFRTPDTPQNEQFDIVISDQRIRDEPRETFSMSAMEYAASAPSRLVILKSSYKVEEAAVYRALKNRENIRLAVLDETLLPWQDLVRKHLREWCTTGMGLRRMAEFYEPIILEDDIEDRKRFVTAGRIVPEQFLQAATDDEAKSTSVAVLEFIGQALADKVPAAVNDTIHSGNRYLLPRFSTSSPVVPWELLLLRDGFDFSTPIVRIVQADGERQDDKVSLSRVLFVKGVDTAADDEIGEVHEAAKRVGGTVKVVDQQEFFDGIDDVFDILHLHMHGPAGPDSPPDPRLQKRLEEQIGAVAPRIVVFNACNSAMLLQAGQLRYPLRLDPLQSILNRGVEACVVTQYVLSEPALAQWSASFYSSLWAFGDVGVAAANAREKIALDYGEFYELATIIVARYDSRLTVGTRST